MQEDKIKPNMKVKLTNLVHRFHYEDDEEYWAGVMNEGYMGTVIGRTTKKKVFDERFYLDSSNYKFAYEIMFTVHHQYSNENIIEYFFPENFELVLREEPKNDIEWLDRIRENFS